MLAGYAQGIFPMAESRSDPTLHWVDPRRRGIIPLDKFHISRSLRRRILHWAYQIRTDTAVESVIAACSARDETWINAPLVALYADLFADGHVHTLEVWEGDELVGGVFGVTLGAVFFGESMFSLRTDASKVALAYLVDRLRLAGFTLFDTQFLTAHLRTLGAIEISRTEYQGLLRSAVKARADFAGAGDPPAPQLLMQRMTQTS
jgi:leucyl/phenylalanyl-tRNA--protein transferase